MSTPAEVPSIFETLTIRMGTEERNLIERAAKTSGKNRNDFIRDALRRATENWGGHWLGMPVIASFKPLK